MKNKKGFTLVELLAVIVILAILATAAFTLVLPQIEKGRRNSFVTEAARVIESADVYFVQHSTPKSNSPVRCVNVKTLCDEGLIKNCNDKWKGRVELDPTKSETKISFKTTTYGTEGTGTYKISDLKDDDGNAKEDKVVKVNVSGAANCGTEN